VDALWIVGLVLVGVAGVALSLYLQAKRRKEFAAFAASYGLRYSRSDPFGVIGWSFRLFARGDGRGAENVMWGDWQGQPVVAFDYWYYERHTDSKGHTRKTYYRFCCAQIDIPAAFPTLEIAPEGFLSRLADFVGLDDIDFELEEFNRRWNVRGSEARFAYELVDSRMIRWLVSLDMPISFEVVGNKLLAYRRKVPATGLARSSASLWRSASTSPGSPGTCTRPRDPRRCRGGDDADRRGILPGPPERREG
jgi:hypothetical protein